MGERFDNEFDRLLAGRLDGDLTASEASRLAELLAGDEGRRRLADELEGVDRIARGLGARRPDVDWSAFRAGVMEQLRREAGARMHPSLARRILLIGVPLSAAAAVVAALTLRWSAGPDAGTRVAPGARQSVVQVVYQRPEEPASPAEAAEISVSFYRSVELERSTAARDAAEQGAPSLAVAAGARVPAPQVPVPASEPFPL